MRIQQSVRAIAVAIAVAVAGYAWAPAAEASGPTPLADSEAASLYGGQDIIWGRCAYSTSIVWHTYCGGCGSWWSFTSPGGRTWSLAATRPCDDDYACRRPDRFYLCGSSASASLD